VNPKATLLGGSILIFGLACAKADHPVARDVRQPGFEPGMFDVGENQSEMSHAVHKARRSVGVFIAALQHPSQGEKDFEVKKPFIQSGRVEHIWLSDVTFSGNRFHGHVDNRPRIVKGVQLGDWVSVNPKEITDWAYLDHNTLVGGYTIRVLYAGLSPERKKKLEHELIFKISR
jgi:uncharacterized protein YegJ (DUF2314 family)